MSDPAQPSDELARRRALVRDAVRYASLAGALICVVVAVLARAELAISIALGTVFAAINFVLLARGVSSAIDRTVAAAEHAGRDGPVEPEEIVDRPRGAGGGFRFALGVLVLAAIALYTPTDPVGLAVGVVLVLVTASVSAYRHQRARTGQT